MEHHLTVSALCQQMPQKPLHPGPHPDQATSRAPHSHWYGLRKVKGQQRLWSPWARTKPLGCAEAVSLGDCAEPGRGAPLLTAQRGVTIAYLGPLSQDLLALPRSQGPTSWLTGQRALGWLALCLLRPIPPSVSSPGKPGDSRLSQPRVRDIGSMSRTRTEVSPRMRPVSLQMHRHPIGQPCQLSFDWRTIGQTGQWPHCGRLLSSAQEPAQPKGLQELCAWNRPPKRFHAPTQSHSCVSVYIHVILEMTEIQGWREDWWVQVGLEGWVGEVELGQEGPCGDGCPVSGLCQYLGCGIRLQVSKKPPWGSWATCAQSLCTSSSFLLLYFYRRKRKHSPPPPEMMQPSFPRLGKAQGSAHPEGNG